MAPPEEVADPLAWSTWPQAGWLIARGRTRRPAFRVALVVGTLLTVVNQADVLLPGSFSVELVARIVANFLIPYVVSSIGFLSAHRRPIARRRPKGPVRHSLRY